MPRKDEWLQQLPDALKALEQLTMPVIDRATLERLLKVHRRVAIRLMHRFGGYQAGRTFLIERCALLRQLQSIAAGEPYQHETTRRERLNEELDRTRHERAARRISIATAPDVKFRQLSGLAPTTRLAPGRLEIACTDAQDLLRQLMELAHAIANDFDRFESLVSKGRLMSL